MSSDPKRPERQSKVIDKGSLHKYRTEIPNTVVKGMKGQGLSLPARWLYVYLKSVAGEEGQCWQNTTTIANGAQIGRGTVTSAKNELIAKKLIAIVPGHHGKHDTDTITITDIWDENMREFATEACSGGEHDIEKETCSTSSSSADRVHEVNTEPDRVQEVNSRVQEVNSPLIGIKKEPSEEVNQDPPVSPKLPKKKTPALGKANALLAYFNERHGRSFENASQIQALLTTGVSVEDCRLVIDWLYDVERLSNPSGYDKYADNVTPFRPLNFDRNREKARRWKAQQHNGVTASPFKVVT